MPKHPQAPPSYTPWNCIILAVDPGEKWGAAIFRRGDLLVNVNSMNMEASIGGVTGRACRIADYNRLPLVVAIETWVPWGRWTFASQMGLAESVVPWKQAVAALPRRRPTTKIVRIILGDWRQAIYGFRQKRSGYDWKAHAIETVRLRRGIDVIDANEAEAILIGEYASRCGEVGKLPGVKLC